MYNVDNKEGDFQMDREQIERITEMESCLNESAEAIRDLIDAVEKYEAVIDRYYLLKEYYTGEAWLKDFEADEQGLLPDDLKRGVLSEDAVYDLLTDHDSLMVRLQKIVLKSMEESR